MKAIANAFRNAGKTAALIPFIPAGFPDYAMTADILHAMESAGADVIELGVPFSDPMADGPIIQRANEKALAGGMTPAKALQQVADYRRNGGKTPIVLMGYANSFLRNSSEQCAEQLAEAGANGIIIVDLADTQRQRWRTALAARDIALIPLVAPTSPPARIQMLTENAAGYVYFISLRGVTGASHFNIDEIQTTVAAVRHCTDTPVAVGFGVREPAQAAALAACADGIVIGSRLIEVIEQSSQPPAAAAAFIGEFAAALHGGGKQTA